VASAFVARNGFSMENSPLWGLEVGEKGKYERKWDMYCYIKGRKLKKKLHLNSLWSLVGGR